MKTLTAILVVLSGLATPSVVIAGTYSYLAPPFAVRTTTWQDVQDYINLHGTYTDLGTEARLRTEAEAGIKTWTVTAASSNSLSKLIDGPSVGWPPARQTVQFATMQEAYTCAGLIDAVTNGASSL